MLGTRARRLTGFLLLSALPVASAALAAAPAEIVVDDTRVFPESLTSSRDGTVWIGSIGKGAIYRAAPGAAVATQWVAPGTDGMKRVLGVLADDASGTLWACAGGDNGGDGQPPTPTAIKAFDIRTGALKASHPFEGGGGCNDFAVAPDGTVYASDNARGRVMRLRKGDTMFREWVATPELASADGVAMLSPEAVYVNTFRGGGLFRVPINRDGSAGAPVRVVTDRPLSRPDGMRPAGVPGKLLVVEGEGRLSELTIKGDSATVRVLKDGIPDSPAAVTRVGDMAYYVQAKFGFMRDPSKDPGRFAAIGVPYTGE